MKWRKPRKPGKAGKPGKPESGLRVRVYLVLGFFLLFFSAILLRAVELQVVDSPDLKRMALKQHRKTLNIQSKRGDIYDRNLKELAVSIEVDSVFAQPGKVESPRSVARSLAPALAVSAGELEKKLRGGANFVWLKRQVDLTDEQRKMVKGLEGVGLMKESRRYYPNRQLASNIIGFTGLDASGLEGVERYYDNLLKGASARFTSDKDAMGRLLLYEDLDKTVPLQGMVVELTIDKTIQYVAEKALKKAVDGSGAKGGTAIVMDPVTGEVLAMANLPSFDPNDIARFDTKHWRNRAIADTFEPGSTLKLFLIAAALDENIVKTTSSFFCEFGSYRVADRVFHDHEKHGWLDVAGIIKHSSNIGSAKIGERLGKVQLYRYMKAFGFGAKSGIDLPGEAAGSLRHYNSWSGVTLQTVSFGQGVSVTGIQLITALSSIANGGFLMKPYVVKSIKDPSGRVVTESHPAVARRIISEDTARKMTEMLIGVTKEDGTGVKAALSDFEVAGKTGTAQKPDLKNGGYASGAYIASFFGFVPARDPRLAILVTVDEPRGEHYGGAIAGPVFKEIAEESLAYMGVFKENRAQPRMLTADKGGSNEEAEDELYAPIDPSRPMAVPDFSGKTVRTVLRIARERSFDVDIKGSGRAVAQRPAPGQSIPQKGPVTVSFQ